MSRMEELVFNFNFAAAGTVLSQGISHNGYITDMIVIIPTFNSGTSLSISIQDVNGLEWWNSGALTDGGKHRIPSADMSAAALADIPAGVNWKMVVTLVSAAGTGGGLVQVFACFKTSRS